MARKSKDDAEVDTMIDESEISEPVEGQEEMAEIENGAEVKRSRSGKTPKELETNFRVQTNHAVQRVDDWLTVVEKCLNSKKYPLTEEEQNKIMGFIEKKYNAFKARYEMKKGRGESFKL